MEEFESFCRGCLLKYTEPNELIQYTEKNRRQFVYLTGLQVKKADQFRFKICKVCFLNMKLACNFKKMCRTANKRIKTYLSMKEAGDILDFCSYLKNIDENLKIPYFHGYSTPSSQNNKDDDNESTTTSIRNFMSDIIMAEEIPDIEARIIREVIQEDADIMDDSLDSQWLDDDTSIDTSFQFDFSMSPFASPKEKMNSNYVKSPVKEIVNYVPKKIVKFGEEQTEPLALDTIDKNLKRALQNEDEEFSLEELIDSPAPVRDYTMSPNPSITSIAREQNLGQYKELFSNVEGDKLDSFYNDKSLENPLQLNFYTEIDDLELDKEKIKKEEKLMKKKNYCEKCDHSFPSFAKLKVHANDVHNKHLTWKKFYICDLCGRQITARSNFIRHLETHNERVKQSVQCSLCKMMFVDAARLRMHMKSHNLTDQPEPDDENARKYCCDVCGAYSTTKSNAILHKRRHGKKYKVYCSICETGFYRPSDLKIHMLIHTNDRPHACSMCEATFKRKDVLNIHMRSMHTDEKPFICRFCDHRFVKRSGLSFHLKKSKRCIVLREKLIRNEGCDSNDGEISVVYGNIVNGIVTIEN